MSLEELLAEVRKLNRGLVFRRNSLEKPRKASKAVP
jgi:hypothetical protein